MEVNPLKEQEKKTYQRKRDILLRFMVANVKQFFL
jgi:hypothetical protein